MDHEDKKMLPSIFCLSTRRKRLQEKGQKELVPVADDKFRIIEGLDKTCKTSVSFQFRRSAWYLRVKSDECIIEPKQTMKHFEECSFYPMVDLWFQGYVAFESVEKAAHYLRLKNGRLILDHYVGSDTFKQEASFFLKKTNSHERKH